MGRVDHGMMNQLRESRGEYPKMEQAHACGQ